MKFVHSHRRWPVVRLLALMALAVLPEVLAGKSSAADSIALAGRTNSGSYAVTVNVDATAGVHPISPLIYGMAWADSTAHTAANITLDRWGGNPTTRYNWQIGNPDNRASDWYFENYGEYCATVTAGCAVDHFVSADRAGGSASIVTIPTIGWVAKDATSCGFSVAKYGQQMSVDPFNTDCGNGILKSTGKQITGNDPHDTSVSVGPALMTSWVQHLVGTFGAAADGGVKLLAMDNEPELWYTTHVDVAPNPLTYDGEYNEFENYATAVKAADATVMVTGPTSWGWSAFFDSSYDYVHNTTSDKQAHGNLDFIPWFLQAVKTHDQQAGSRSLDVLDLHWYPQGTNVFGGSCNNGCNDATTNALRLRETRNLWDPSYVDESWIGAQTYLLPRMKSWVDSYYPGTRFGLGEWDYGNDGHINGAIAIGDVLGILGWKGAYFADYWTQPADGSPGQMAFEMYRNYDGAKSTFGDTSIQATSSNTNELMSFGSLRSSSGQMLLMLVNQDPSNSAQTTVNLANYAPASAAAVYQYSSANLGAIQHLSDIAVGNQFAVSLPAYSITLLVLSHGRLARQGSPTPGTPTATPTAVGNRQSRITPTAVAVGTATPTPTSVSGRPHRTAARAANGEGRPVDQFDRWHVYGRRMIAHPPGG